MGEARGRQLWDHTSELMALIANGLLVGKGSRHFTGQQFHPFRQRTRRVHPADRKMGFSMLKAALSKKEGS